MVTGRGSDELYQTDTFIMKVQIKSISGGEEGGTPIFEAEKELSQDLLPFLAFSNPIGSFLCLTLSY